VYQGFYQFSRDPFAAPADARHIFMAAGHRDALSGVVLDVLKRRPFVAVGGNSEVGKTTVLNAALASLADQRRRKPVHVTRLDHSYLTAVSARQIVAQLLRKRTGELINHDLQRLFHTLTDCGKDGSQHVLVIDDAPSVNPGALEFLRLVSGLQTLERTSMQVILAGRNEFWDASTGDGGWAARDQIANRAAIEPLAEEEVRQYIDYRLQLADSSIGRVMTDAALGDVMRHGHALPGRINRILDRAFTVGAEQGFSRLTPRVVDDAVTSLEAANLLPPVPVAAAGAAATQGGPTAASIIFNTATINTASINTGGPVRRAPAEQPDSEDAIAFVPPPAAWRSTWLAGAAAAAVFGIALTGGMLLPRIMPHFAAASVASVEVAPHPTAPVAAPVAHASSSVAPTQDAGVPGPPKASPEPAPVTNTAARTADEHPAATVEAPAEAPAQPAPTMTARPAALPEPPPAATPAVPEPVAPAIQTAMASPAPLPAAVTADPAPPQPEGRVEAPPPEPAPMAADPVAMPPSPNAPPAASPLPPEVLTMLLGRGATMLAAGDITAARLLYKRAADAGSAQAAMEIGRTYEPTFLANKRAIGIQADPAIAAGWYRRALSLGGTKAASLAVPPGAVVAR
jgi:type II secretory pathway predicted ATPase ExeA